jgi:hypothetical protein
MQTIYFLLLLSLCFRLFLRTISISLAPLFIPTKWYGDLFFSLCRRLRCACSVVFGHFCLFNCPPPNNQLRSVSDFAESSMRPTGSSRRSKSFRRYRPCESNSSSRRSSPTSSLAPSTYDLPPPSSHCCHSSALKPLGGRAASSCSVREGHHPHVQVWHLYVRSPHTQTAHTAHRTQPLLARAVSVVVVDSSCGILRVSS